jgi:hypothetical protein
VTQVGLGSSPAPCPGRPCPLCLGAGVTLGLSVPGQDARGKLRPRTSQDLRRVPASPRPRVPAAARLPARVYIAAPKIGLGWPRGGVAAHGVASCPAKMFPADSGRALSVTGDTAGTGRPAGRGAGGLALDAARPPGWGRPCRWDAPTSAVWGAGAAGTPGGCRDQGHPRWGRAGSVGARQAHGMEGNSRLREWRVHTLAAGVSLSPCRKGEPNWERAS